MTPSSGAALLRPAGGSEGRNDGWRDGWHGWRDSRQESAWAKRIERRVSLVPGGVCNDQVNYSFAATGSTKSIRSVPIFSDEKAKAEATHFFGLVDRDELEVGRGTVADKAEADRKLGRRQVRGFATGAGSTVIGTQGAGLPNLPRERFVESAYWNPSVVTDKEGKAVVKFKAPMALSSYQMTARGVSGADTLVGQTTAELTVRKDFFVDLKVPSALTQGDKPRFIAQVHHLGLKGSVALKLAIYAGGRDQVFPKTIEVKDDGVDEVVFDPFEIPDGENVRLTLTAESGTVKDELVVEVPVRPWGVQAIASASGTSSNDATVFVGLPGGRTYENPEMLVVISPTLRRLIVELALGREYYPMKKEDIGLNACIAPPTLNTIADRASDLLATTSALTYLKSSREAAAAPEAQRLTERIQGLVAELIAAQNEDGGWPWVPRSGYRRRPSPDPATGTPRLRSSGHSPRPSRSAC